MSPGFLPDFLFLCQRIIFCYSLIFIIFLFILQLGFIIISTVTNNNNNNNLLSVTCPLKSQINKFTLFAVGIHLDVSSQVFASKFQTFILKIPSGSTSSLRSHLDGGSSRLQPRQQQQKRPASSVSLSALLPLRHPSTLSGSPLLLQPRRSHSERAARRTKPPRKKWHFNTGEIVFFFLPRRETWIRSPSSTSSSTSSSSLPSAASPLLLTGGSVSKTSMTMMKMIIIFIRSVCSGDSSEPFCRQTGGGLLFYHLFSALCQYCISPLHCSFT